MEDDLRVRVLLDARGELPDPLGDRLTSLRRRPCRVDLHVGLLHHVAHLPGDTRPKIWRLPAPRIFEDSATRSAKMPKHFGCTSKPLPMLPLAGRSGTDIQRVGNAANELSRPGG